MDIIGHLFDIKQLDMFVAFAMDLGACNISLSENQRS